MYAIKNTQQEIIMSEHVKEITSAQDLNALLDQGLPVVIDFWAPWCGPCRHMSPIFHHVAKEMDGRVNFCKINIDEAQEIAGGFHVMSIPTFVTLKDGKEVARQVGGASEDALMQWIDEGLLK